MMYFCPETGLPVFAPAGAGRNVAAVSLPDLLDEQQAQIQLMCDCGVSSSHQVACAISIKGNRAFPTSQRVDLVVCPGCGDKIPLLRPLVIHDEPRQRIVLRLPESFRSRANATLSWWFDWCQRTSRPVLPGYTRHPLLEFVSFARTSTNANTNAKASPSQPSLQQPAQANHRNAGNHSGRSSGRSTPLMPARSQLSGLPVPVAPSHHEVHTTEPTHEVVSSVHQPGEPAEQAPSQDSLHQKSLMESLLPPSANPISIEIEDGSDAKTSGIDFLDKQKTTASAAAVSSGHLRDNRQTVGFGAHDASRMANELGYGKLPFGELPLDELSGEFKGLDEEPEDGMPTLMVANSEPANQQKKKQTPARRTVALSSMPSVVVSPDELGMLHVENEEDDGTIVGNADKNKPLVRVMTREDASQSSFPSDPGATREAPAPILGAEDLAAVEHISTTSPTLKDRRVERPASRELAALAAAEFDVMTTKPVEALPDTPTIARRVVPQSISDIRANQSKAATAIRNIVGNGISASPEYDNARPPHDETLAALKASDDHYHFGMSPDTQRCTLHFSFPLTSARILDQGGEVTFYAQLHRLPSYPLLVFLFTFQDSHGEPQDVLACPLDIEDHNALIFLDMLMQDFALHCNLCDETLNVYRDLQVQLPLEDNIEYLLEKARVWKNSINPSSQSFSRAWREFNTPGYDRHGKMEHNFSRDSFTDINTPAKAQLASGIVAYWSEPEQYDYLLTMKSFPIAHFQTVQRRTIEGCLAFGIFLPEHLRQKAIEFTIVESQQELLQQLISSFAETNLAIRQANDLDPWDNLTNWQKLLDTCDEFHVEVDADIEELAELAQRRCQTDGENTHNIDDEDIVEIGGYQDMDPRELLELLQDTEHRVEAALALCDTQDPEFADYVAGVFANLEREEAILLAEAFTQFGSEAEPLLISWLHLPRPYHREAAMLALGTMSSTQAIDEIIKRLRSGEEWETAAEALGRIGEAAIESLSTEIKNKNWLIRLRAVKALQKIPSGKTRALFEQLQSDPNEVVKAEVAMILNG